MLDLVVHSFFHYAIFPFFFRHVIHLTPTQLFNGFLEPHIDARTMEIHHGKHHQTYVDKLNAALTNEESLSGMQVDDLIKDLTVVPEPIRQAVRNNGGGHSNHTFFGIASAQMAVAYHKALIRCHLIHIRLFRCLQRTLCKCCSHTIWIGGGLG